MATYTIGSVSHSIKFDEVIVLKQIVAQVANKLNLSPFENKVRCGSNIDHEWLGAVVEELDRWYLDDYDPENDQMTIPKEDIAEFQKLSELVTTIVSQNNRKKEKFVTTAQAKVMSSDWSTFLSEFTPQVLSIQDFHRRGRFLLKPTLHDLVSRVQKGIESGKKIRWRD